MSAVLEKIAEQLYKIRGGIKQLKDMEDKLMKSAYEEVAKTKEKQATGHGVFTFVNAGESTKVDYKKYIIDKGVPAVELEPYTTKAAFTDHIKFTPGIPKEPTVKALKELTEAVKKVEVKTKTSMFDSE